VNGQLHAPGILPPGKEPCIPTEYEAKWAPESVCTWWQEEKIPTPVRNLTSVIQSID